MYMELAIKATNAQKRYKSGLPIRIVNFSLVIKILTRPVATSSRSGANCYTYHEQFVIWPSRPQSSHIGSTMDLAANKRCGGRRHSCLHVMPSHTGVNHEMRADKRFAGRPHACLPTVSQQCARSSASDDVNAAEYKLTSLLSPASQSSMIPC